LQKTFGQLETIDKEKELSRWVHEYADYLYSWASYKVKDSNLAQDLVQETFLSAFTSIDGFKGNSSAKTWLTTILNRKIIDHYRKVSRRPEGVITEENERNMAATDSMFNENNRWQVNGLESMWQEEENLLDDHQFNHTFDGCLKDLPPVWYASVTAKFILQKKPDAICQELGISMSNYWQVIHRAKLQLKKCLDTKWFGKD